MHRPPNDQPAAPASPDEAAPASPAALVAELVDLLALEEIDVDLYRGKRKRGGVGRVFGGQVIAQALQAAQHAVDAPRAAHSLHGYFMRPGSEDHPILYRVTRDFDGRSLATRRVVAMQRGQPILTLTASFQIPEEGLHHQDAMPDVPTPDELPAERAMAAAEADRLPAAVRPALLRRRPIEFRPVQAPWWSDKASRRPRQQNWFRLVAPLDADPAMHRAILAYVSDMGLMATALLPHHLNLAMARLKGASLDHALWLHEPFRVDEWLLFDCDSPWSGHARGFNRARIFAADGRLVASVAQEGLMRLVGE